MAKEAFTTVAPMTPKGGKWLVCYRRVGSKERFTPIAECRSEGHAETIVSALNLQQGKIAELEVPAQRVADELREALKKERALTDQLRADMRTRDGDLRVRNMELSQKSAEIGALRGKLTAAEARIVSLESKQVPA